MADQQSPTLQPPGGGSTLDPMPEARVATLEADVRHIRDSFADVKMDLREVRSDLNSFRAETQSEFQKLRGEVQSEFQKLRTEMQSEFQKLLGDTQSDSQKLRTETQSSINKLEVNFAVLNERVAHLPTKGYIGWWITFGMSAMVAALTILSRLGFLVPGVTK